MSKPGKIAITYPGGEVSTSCEVTDDGKLLIERVAMIEFLAAAVKLDDEEVFNIIAGA